ncbi:Os03g0641900 [Oryza sativa Japonica Group]|uniref:Uncharacterized protein n=2 Tax=Oryza sativa subsp. japonica TaxID=39947 RepID=A0A8J8Y008_ORYSJ|nr:hypothetical protein OsJ_11866 [Oryza sativa Japonica Group]BAS85439.1 Os03g0641900 [Oryza sativa Japonica Group]
MLQLHRPVSAGIINTATGQRITPPLVVGIASLLPPSSRRVPTSRWILPWPPRGRFPSAADEEVGCGGGGGGFFPKREAVAELDSPSE